MNTPVVAMDALVDGPGLFQKVRAFGRSAGTDESRELLLPPPMPIEVAASLLCQAWAVSVTRAAIASLVGARRVPDLSASNTVLSVDRDGRPVGASLRAPRYAALATDAEAAPALMADPIHHDDAPTALRRKLADPDEATTAPTPRLVRHDDAAAAPEVVLVDDEEELFAWARARLFDGHLGPLVEALHDIAPIGRRLLWGNVAAATAGAFAALSATAPWRHEPDRLLDDARRLLDHPGSPTSGLAELFPVPHDDATRLFVRRQTCCLRYRLPDAPPTCLSCRLMPEPERRRRIALRLQPSPA